MIAIFIEYQFQDHMLPVFTFNFVGVVVHSFSKSNLPCFFAFGLRLNGAFITQHHKVQFVKSANVV